MAKYKKSPIDDLFYNLMGHYPSKEGKAYEIISTAVLGLIENKEAVHDKYLIGESESKYQLDGLIDENIMLEAKDYTKAKNKVGRGDLQKLQGALTDLPQIKKGYFASATNYTMPAQRYAKGSSTNSYQKEIVPIELRPSILDDEKERIKEIVLNITAVFPDFHAGKYEVLFLCNERQKLENYIKELKLNEFHLQIHCFYNEQGDVIETMENLSNIQFPKFEMEATEIEGVFNISAFVKVERRLFAIEGIKYRIPIQHSENTFMIKSNGNATILVKSDKLGINKLITDTDMKNAINKVLKHCSAHFPDRK